MPALKPTLRQLSNKQSATAPAWVFESDKMNMNTAMNFDYANKRAKIVEIFKTWLNIFETYEAPLNSDEHSRRIRIPLFVRRLVGRCVVNRNAGAGRRIHEL